MMMDEGGGMRCGEVAVDRRRGSTMKLVLLRSGFSTTSFNFNMDVNIVHCGFE